MKPHIKSSEDILSGNDINNLLGLYPSIEEKHFKLWLTSTNVIKRVLHNAEKSQTDYDVARVQRQIPLYVQNRNYSRALAILSANKAVIISGVPGIGKTMLADMLLYTHLESGFEPVVIKNDISEGRRLFAQNKKQIFYFDDFLSETFLGHRFDFTGKREDSAIIDFVQMVALSKASRIILTTREHILSHAFQLSEKFRRQKSEFLTHKCILDVRDYTLTERGRILYNHIYFSDLPNEYRRELLRDRFYMEVLKHRNFNPRLIEWLARKVNLPTISALGFQQEVRRILDNPEQLWQIAFEQQISEPSRSLLLALYSLGGHARLDRLEQAWSAIHQYRSTKYNWPRTAED